MCLKQTCELAPTIGVGKVRHLTLKQLKSLDAGYNCINVHGENFRHREVRLLSLDELFDCYPSTPINIDIKDRSLLAAKLVAECIERCQRQHDAIVGSFHQAVLDAFRQLAPMVKTVATQREVARQYFQHCGLPAPRDCPKFVSVQVPISYRLIRFATARFIDHVHRIEKEICFWTVNDSVRIRQLLALGADGIVTDRPDLALAIFKERGIK